MQLKENNAQSGFVVDREDSSLTVRWCSLNLIHTALNVVPSLYRYVCFPQRSDQYFKQLFENSGVAVLKTVVGHLSDRSVA